MWKIFWLDDEFVKPNSSESLIKEGISMKLADTVEIEVFSNSAELIDRLDHFAADLIILDIMGFDSSDDIGNKPADQKGFYEADKKILEKKIPVIIFSGNLGGEGTPLYKNYLQMFDVKRWRVVSKNSRDAEQKLLDSIKDELNIHPYGQYNFFNEIIRNHWIPGLKNDETLKDKLRKIIKNQVESTRINDSMDLVNYMRSIINRAFMGEKCYDDEGKEYIALNPLIKRKFHDELARYKFKKLENLNNLVYGITFWYKNGDNKDRVITMELLPVEVRFALLFLVNATNSFSHNVGVSTEFNAYVRGHDFASEANKSVLSLIYNSFFVVMEWFYAFNKKYQHQLKE